MAACSADGVRGGMKAGERRGSSRQSVARIVGFRGRTPAVSAHCAATAASSSSSVRAAQRSSVGSVSISSTVARLRHLATILGLMSNARPTCAGPQSCPRTDGGRAFALRSPYCCSVGLRGRGAAITNLSHRASFHSCERIAPSNLGIKHLIQPSVGKRFHVGQVERRRQETDRIGQPAEPLVPLNEINHHFEQMRMLTAVSHVDNPMSYA